MDQSASSTQNAERFSFFETEETMSLKLEELPKYVKAFVNPHVLLANISDTKALLHNANQTPYDKKKHKSNAHITISEADKRLFEEYPHLLSFHPSVLHHERAIINRWYEQIYRRRYIPAQIPFSAMPSPTPSFQPQHQYTFTFEKTSATQRKMSIIRDNTLLMDPATDPPKQSSSEAEYPEHATLDYYDATVTFSTRSHPHPKESYTLDSLKAKLASYTQS